MAEFPSRTSNDPSTPNHIPNPSVADALHQYPAAKSEPATQVPQELNAPS